MDPAVILDHIDAISLVPLLIWQSFRMEKKLDAQAERMEEQRKENDERNTEMIRGWERQLADLNNRSDEKEERLRDRYDQTIAKIDLEKKAQSDKALEEIRALGVKVDDMTRFLSRPSGR